MRNLSFLLRRICLAILLFFLFTTAGCKLEINANPQKLCGEGDVTLFWKEKGYAEIELSGGSLYKKFPILGKDGSIADEASGTEKVHLTGPATFYITGTSKDRTDQSSVNVEVGRRSVRHSLKLDFADCHSIESGNSLTTYQGDILSSAIQGKNEVIQEVFNANNREVAVDFKFTSPVAGQSRTQVFNNFSPVGQWKASLKLKEGQEKCPLEVQQLDTPGYPPSSLELRISYGCASP